MNRVTQECFYSIWVFVFAFLNSYICSSYLLIAINLIVNYLPPRRTKLGHIYNIVLGNYKQQNLIWSFQLKKITGKDKDVCSNNCFLEKWSKPYPRTGLRKNYLCCHSQTLNTKYLTLLNHYCCQSQYYFCIRNSNL